MIFDQICHVCCYLGGRLQTINRDAVWKTCYACQGILFLLLYIYCPRIAEGGESTLEVPIDKQFEVFWSLERLHAVATYFYPAMWFCSSSYSFSVKE